MREKFFDKVFRLMVFFIGIMVLLISVMMFLEDPFEPLHTISALLFSAASFFILYTAIKIP